jgi:hypothetical protein
MEWMNDGKKEKRKQIAGVCFGGGMFCMRK